MHYFGVTDFYCIGTNVYCAAMYSNANLRKGLSAGERQFVPFAWAVFNGALLV